MKLNYIRRALAAEPVKAAVAVIRALLGYSALCCLMGSNAISVLFGANPLTAFEFFKYVLGVDVFGYTGTSVLAFIVFLFIAMLEVRFRDRHLRPEEIVCCCILALFVQAGMFISSVGSFAEAITTRRGVLFAVGFLGCACAFRLVFFGLHLAVDWLRRRNWAFANRVPAFIGRHATLFTWLLLCLCWLPFAVVRYPGGIEWDAFNQINQYLTGTLTNHWPVASSALMGSFVSFGHSVFGSNDAGLFLYVLALMTVTAAILSYSLKVLRELGVPHAITAAVLGIYVFCPIFPVEATSVVKDTPYADCVALFTILVAEELFGLRRGKPVVHYMCLALVALAMCLMRNNGVFILCFFVAFLAVRWIWKRRLYRGLMCICIAVIGVNLVYTNALLPALGISQTSQSEALSLPLQQTARYIKEYPDDLSDAEREALSRVFDLSSLGEQYNPLLSDPVKGNFNSAYDGDGVDLRAYFAAWASMGLRHPLVYIDAALNTPLGFYYPDTVISYGDQLYIYGPTQHIDGVQLEFGAHPQLEEARGRLANYAYAMTRFPLTYPFVNTGVATWIVVCLAAYALARKRGLFLLILPSLVGVLVCFASPTFWWNGARYALPILFSNPFCMAAILFARWPRGKGAAPSREDSTRPRIHARRRQGGFC